MDLYSQAVAAAASKDYSDQGAALITSAAAVEHETANLKMTDDQYKVWAKIKDLLKDAY